jgi:site-specific DNA recombinase
MTAVKPVPTKAIGHVRVSTKGQATEGVSLAAQRDRIEAWCKANGYDLITLHVDAGLSGKRADNRPSLQTALREACLEPGVALIVYSLSRLARSVKDTLEIAGLLERAGADLVGLSERIDTTTAAGRLVFRMLAVLAEFERDLCSERTKSALALKKRRGECVGQVPYGWRREGPMLIAQPEEQQNLRLLRSLRKRGMTYRAIADALSHQGISTAKSPARWHARTVQRILSRDDWR